MTMWKIKITALVAAIVLAIGTYTHLDFIQTYGWFAYSEVEQVSWLFNIYWTLLLFINLIVIAILVWRPWVGLQIFAVHMAINTFMNGISLLIYTEGTLLHGPSQVWRQFFILCIACAAIVFFRLQHNQKSKVLD